MRQLIGRPIRVGNYIPLRSAWAAIAFGVPSVMGSREPEVVVATCTGETEIGLLASFVQSELMLSPRRT